MVTLDLNKYPNGKDVETFLKILVETSVKSLRLGKSLRNFCRVDTYETK